MNQNTGLLYSRIEKHITGLIESGRLKEGDRLPSEPELSRQFNASRIPVRQATQKLVDQGIVERVHGKGTFVKLRKTRDVLTHRIGILYWPKEENFFNSEFYATIFSGISEEAEREHKYLLTHSLRKYDHSHPSRVFEDLMDEVDGFIIVDLVETLYRQIKGSLVNLPKPAVVLVYDGLPNTVDSIVFDNTNDTARIIQLLIDNGHQRMACMYNRSHMDPNGAKSIFDRVKAFKNTLQDNGLTPNENWIKGRHSDDYSDPLRKSDIFRQFSQMMEGPDRPTAIYCVSDMIAIHVYEMAAALGLRIPDDLAVAGFDDMKKVGEIDPPLTTIHAPLKEMGQAAVRRLQERIEERQQGTTTHRKIILSGGLMERESHKKS
jgi:DNA-binding LacI/PurR family transcriptional regulator